MTQISKIKKTNNGDLKIPTTKHKNKNKFKENLMIQTINIRLLSFHMLKLGFSFANKLY